MDISSYVMYWPPLEEDVEEDREVRNKTRVRLNKRRRGGGGVGVLLAYMQRITHATQAVSHCFLLLYL